MNLILKPRQRGFYVDANGNYYIKDQNWYRPLYPHVIHESKVDIISDNGHDSTYDLTNVKKEIDNKSEQKYKPPTSSDEIVCNLTGG